MRRPPEIWRGAGEGEGTALLLHFFQLKELSLSIYEKRPNFQHPQTLKCNRARCRLPPRPPFSHWGRGVHGPSREGELEGVASFWS